MSLHSNTSFIHTTNNLAFHFKTVIQGSIFERKRQTDRHRYVDVCVVYFSCVYICVPTVYVTGTTRSAEDIGSPRTGVTDICEPLCWC